MSRFITRLLVSLFTIFMSVGAVSAASAADTDFVVVTAGDSITQGVGASYTKSYPSVYAKQTGNTTINVGHGGSCILTNICGYGPRLLDTIEAEAFSQNPDLLVVAIGVNDLCHRSTFDLKQAYRSIQQMAAARNVRVLFGTITPYGEKWPWQCEVQRVQINEFLRRAMPVVDFAAALDNSKGQLRHRYDSGDGLHPNARGYRAMARTLRFAA